MKEFCLNLQPRKYVYMEALNIKGTSTTPIISFDPTTGILGLSGNSRPENVFDFYEPILKWIKDYSKNPSASTSLHVKLNYFNSSTANTLHRIINILSNLHSNGNDVEVFWYYDGEDEESLETGKDYASLVEMPFTFTRINMKY